MTLAEAIADLAARMPRVVELWPTPYQRALAAVPDVERLTGVEPDVVMVEGRICLALPEAVLWPFLESLLVRGEAAKRLDRIPFVESESL